MIIPSEVFLYFNDLSQPIKDIFVSFVGFTSLIKIDLVFGHSGENAYKLCYPSIINQPPFHISQQEATATATAAISMLFQSKYLPHQNNFFDCLHRLSMLHTLTSEIPLPRHSQPPFIAAVTVSDLLTKSKRLNRTTPRNKNVRSAARSTEDLFL